ncbi:DUF6541 family protein [Amycolatopsis sp. PS_44_ISF1]|uniref:DUF6541 family protein n=1 Tax=Amycolatopsis sp. PS_44_ISF1 TaxID=2974917 RepID=UPI0028DF7475|nr:DUF6541 family protein [Amycolatopsis sp. PS_44_ISF1]MDT8910809.1 hypothetical protein [Amycolatopsis sp. PS_44_ISF1]
MNVVLILLAFWVPGLVFGTAIGLRGWTLAAAGPLLTFGLVALGIPVLGGLGLRWNLLHVALWVVLLALVGFGLGFAVRRFTARRHPEWAADEPEPDRSVRDHGLIGLGVLGGMTVGVVTFLRGSHGITTVQQGWDAVFHGNLVRWIAEHGDARPSTVGTIANLPDQKNYFYPDTYHALLALVFGKGGLTMMPTLNLAAMAVIISVPLGVAAMGRAWNLTPLATAAAAAVTTWFTAFPYDSLQRGPLWPYVAGVAMIPAMLALAKYLLRPRGIAGPIAIGVGVAGLTGLHTSVVFVIAVYFILILGAVLFGWEKIDWRRSAPSLVASVVLAAVLGLPLVLPSLYNASGVTSAFWASEATVSGGVGETITFSPMADYPQWWVGIPAIIGIFLLVKHRRMMWMVGAYVVFGGLFAATVSLETPLVHTLTSIFYNDHWRIAALVPLAGAVAFGESVDTAGQWFARRAKALAPRVKLKPATLTLVGAVLLGLVLAGLSRGGYIGRNTNRLEFNYSDGPTVSKAEEAAYAWLGRHTAPGERVMNDKGDGSSWMYALSGVMPVEWTFYGADAGTEAAYLSTWLDNIDLYPKVRQDLTALNVRYVIVGQGAVTTTAKHSVGVRLVRNGSDFREVFHNEGATIYQIEGQPGVVASGAAPGSGRSAGH